MTPPDAPRWDDALERRALNHGEQGESAEELEVLSLRAQLREAQAAREHDPLCESLRPFPGTTRGACDCLAGVTPVEQGESAEELEILSLRAQLREALAEVERLKAGTELTPAQLAAYTLSLEEWRRRGVIEEREACARAADRYGRTFGRTIAAALRARRA